MNTLVVVEVHHDVCARCVVEKPSVFCRGVGTARVLHVEMYVVESHGKSERGGVIARIADCASRDDDAGPSSGKIFNNLEAVARPRCSFIVQVVAKPLTTAYPSPHNRDSIAMKEELIWHSGSKRVAGV